MIKNNLLLKSFRDFFTAPVLKLAFLPFVLSLIVMYSLFLVAADYGFDQLENAMIQVEQQQTMVENGTVHTESYSATAQGPNEIVEFLLKYSVFSWLLSFLVYTVGSFFIVIVSIVVALFIIGFLTPPILRIIQRRHYPDVEMIGHDNLLSMIWYFLKSFIIMVALFLLLMPFYFIPVLNIVAINIPFYYLFHKMMIFDVASTITTKEEYKRIMYYEGRKVRLKTALLYVISLIPFAIFFTTAFFVVYLGHTFFKDVKKIRTVDHGDRITE